LIGRKNIKGIYMNENKNIEIIKGILVNDPYFNIVKSNEVLYEVLYKTRIRTDDDKQINIMAFNNEAKKLNTLNKNDCIIVKGYRKYNDFIKTDEFIIIQIIKRYKNDK